MKDHLTALLEAVRLAQAVLEQPVGEGCMTSEARIGKLKAVLNDRRVIAAVDAFYPSDKTPVPTKVISGLSGEFIYSARR